MPRTMTNRERVLATLNHKQPDVVPYDIGFTQVAHARMVKYTGDPDFVSKLGNCLSGIRADPPDAWREVRPDVWQDRSGRPWSRRG